jgi:hypothetical protein
MIPRHPGKEKRKKIFRNNFLFLFLKKGKKIIKNVELDNTVAFSMFRKAIRKLLQMTFCGVFFLDFSYI